MAGDFLGSGWRFPLVPDATGRLGYTSGSDNVEQSMRLLLMTRLRERRMQPRIGTEVADLVFAPGSPAFLDRLEQTIREAVRDWEPRVELLGVEAQPDEADPTVVRVSIDYRIRRSNNRLNLVFPYYLEELG